jgi:hypothetical protein
MVKRSSNFRTTFFVWMIVFLSFWGCTKAFDYPNYSGFLGDYRGLYRSNVTPGLFQIDNPKKMAKDYSRFYVAPVMSYLTPTSNGYNLSPKVVESRAAEFQGLIKNSLANKYTVVDSPGEGVLVMKFAITDLFDGQVKNKARATLEAEFVDGLTGERINAFVYGGKPKTFSEWADLVVNRLTELGKEMKVYVGQDKNK